MKIKILTILIAFTIFGCNNETPIDAKTQAILGTPAPAFEITGFTGNTINLEKHKGKPIVINFWASWCMPCQKEAEDLENVYKFFKNRQVQFIGIASDDKEVDARKFIEEYKITYPNGMDENKDVSKKYSVLTLPITFIIDRDGKIAFKKIGKIDEDRLKKEIRKVL